MPAQDTTALLAAWQAGESPAADELLARLYHDMKRLAAVLVRRERAATIQATELVGEAYIRLVGLERLEWRDRTHFLRVAARLMRRILIDRARARSRLKRGGGASPQPWDDNSGQGAFTGDPGGAELVVLDDALARLREIDEQAATIVDLRYFSGLTVDETAAAVGLGRSTVVRRWRFARAWLRDAVGQR